jgi:hypothetical protein
MRLLGTIDEWIKHDPNAILKNDKFLQDGVGIESFKKHDAPFKANYASRTPDEGQPVIHYGASCFYRNDGVFNYSCFSTSIWGSGGSQVLSDKQANDPNWYKIDSIEEL